MRLNIDESLTRQAVDMKGISAQDLSNTFGRRDEPVITHSELPTSSKIDRNIKNQFLASAFEAFKSHWGFVLSPSQIFLLLIQQISLHVNAHPEELRSQFVNHEGKKELRVMVSASPSAHEWASAIENIREQIAANTVPDTYDLFSLQEFSTTTSIEQVAGDIALMDVCQSYFSYLFRTMCGIPFFLLQGTVEDWETLREKAEQVILRKTLPDFSARWLPALLPVLDKIVRARRGEEVDSAFWNSFVKIGAVHGSGGYTYASGWINSFFPLVSSKEANPYCVPLESNPIYLEYVRGGGAALKKAAAERGGRGFHREPVTGLDVSDYPSGVSAVPANWDRNGLSISLSVKSGFVGAVCEEGAIQPAVGWWIVESKEKKGDFDS